MKFNLNAIELSLPLMDFKIPTHTTGLQSAFYNQPQY